MAASSSKVLADHNDIFVDYDPSRHVTRNVLTKYEKTAALSMRIEQLQRGAAPCVEAAPTEDACAIALAELDAGRLPFVVVRTLPNDTKEYWRIRDLMVLRNQ